MTHEMEKVGSLAVVAGSAPSYSRYAWIDENRTRCFKTWAEEIAHMQTLGFALCAPEYHIPHWSQAAKAPKLYVSTRHGPREMTTCFDRPASDLGYPLFLQNDQDQTRPAQISSNE